MKGRKPTPTAAQIAMGDPRKKGVHKLDQQLEAEPKAQRGLPECPERVQGLAREQWHVWKEDLEGMELDAHPDAVMLEGACIWFARAVEADALIAKSGQIVAQPVLDRQGNKVGTKVVEHPALGLSREAWVMVRSFCSEFGLSPTARTRLAVERNKQPVDQLEQILNADRELPERFNKLQ